MAKLIWTKQAVNDLDSIGVFISQDSPKYARLTIKRIRESTTKLKNLPKLGRIVPERNSENIREIILGPYRIMYYLELNLIYVLTIHHSSRNFEPGFLGV